MMLLFWSLLLAAVIGVALKAACDHLTEFSKITWVEYSIGLALCAAVVVPGVVVVGRNVALSNNLSFNEYWNGWEVDAVASSRTCTKTRGFNPCRHTYDCDPYQELVTKTRYVTKTRTNSKGQSETYTDTETYTEWETRWESCPYVTEEWSYDVHTTLENYTVAGAVFPADYQAKRYRADDRLPDHVVSSAGVGAPAEWVAVRERLDRGEPGGVTVVKPYDNYILASQYSILKRYSTSIDRYREAKLLPANASGIQGRLRADKAHLVGVPGEDRQWETSVARFNAALGTERQGDLQLVAVDSNVVTDADDYLGALIAAWQAPDRGDDALSKNALVLVVGVADGKVTWARGATGMPQGNEDLLARVPSALKGVEFTPDAILGRGQARVDLGSKRKVTFTRGDAAFEKIVFADPGFKRSCMLCEDADDEGLGFSYLSGDIQPDAGQKRWIVFFAALASLVVWGALLALDVNIRRWRGSDDHDRPGGTSNRFAAPYPSAADRRRAAQDAARRLTTPAPRRMPPRRPPAR